MMIKHCQLTTGISCYADEMLPEEEMAQMTAHIELCTVCADELARLRRFDSLFKTKLFSEPSKEYWDSVSDKVIQRLRLKPRKSWIAHIIDYFPELWQGRRVQLTGFGAFALVVVTFIFLKNWNQPTQSKNEKVATGTVAQETALTTVQTEHLQPTITESQIPDTQITGIEPVPAVVARVKSTPKSTVPVKAETVLSTAKTYNQPQMIQARKLKLIARRYKFNQRLLPLPNIRYLFADKMTTTSEKGDVEVQIFSSNSDGIFLPNVGNVDPDKQISKFESDFAQTLWLVQNSNTLVEKRNIWLSFISREIDDTYLALGVYNLALVFIDLTDETKLREDAKQAIDFYQKYESILRPLMKDKQYEMNLDALITIVE